MKLTLDDILQIRSAFAVCRIADIDAVVITDNKIRGITQTSKMAIMSDVSLSVDPKIKIGIGRIDELEKRFGIFGENVNVEGKVNDKDDVGLLTISTGKSKLQFRCTSERMIKYPKSNEDPVMVVVSLAKAELAELTKAVKTLGAEHLTLKITKDGYVGFECSSSTNEVFSTQTTKLAEFEGDPQAIVYIYEGSRLATVLDAASRDVEEVDLVIGEFGSITLGIKGHTMLILPDSNNEDDNDE